MHFVDTYPVNNISALKKKQTSKLHIYTDSGGYLMDTFHETKHLFQHILVQI